MIDTLVSEGHVMADFNPVTKSDAFVSSIGKLNNTVTGSRFVSAETPGAFSLGSQPIVLSRAEVQPAAESTVITAAVTDESAVKTSVADLLSSAFGGTVGRARIDDLVAAPGTGGDGGGPNIALAVMDAGEEVVIDNNVFKGNISIYGINKGGNLTRKVMQNLDSRIEQRTVSLSGTTASHLQFRGNQMYRLVIGENKISQLKQASAQGGTIADLFNVIHFSDNVIWLSKNQWLCLHNNVKANYFPATDYAGVSVANQGVFMGNQSDDDVQIFCVGGPVKEAANFVGISEL
jgi:hypothetical protein